MSGIISRADLDLYKDGTLAATILVCVFLAVYVNFLLGIDIVYTHLFYIPIILAGLWHHKKAVYVAVFLGVLHISLDYIVFGTVMPSSVMRSIVFIIVAFSAGALSEVKDKLNVELKESYEKLSDANAELSNLVEFYPDATLVIDGRGRVVYWNKAMEDMTGVPCGDMIGKGDHEYAVPFYGHRRNMLIDMLGMPDEVLLKEYPDVTRKNGKLEAAALKVRVKGKDVYVYCTASMLYDNHGKVIGAIESIRDITVQKAMEEELKKAHDSLEVSVAERTAELATARSTLQTILDTIPIGVVVADAATGRITYMTRNASEILGCGPGGKVVGQEKECYQLLHVDGTAFAPNERPLARAILTGEHTGNLDIVVRRADGREVFTLVSCAPVYDEEGAIVSAVASFADITERRRAVLALKDSEEKFRSLVESISDWVWEIDENSLFTYSSPKIKDVLGFDADAIKGKTPIGFMAPDEAKRFSRVLHGLMADRKPFDMVEHTMIGKELRPVILETSGTPVFDVNGSFKGFRGISRDVTRRKKAEMALLKSEARNAALLDAIPDMIFRLSRDGTIMDYKADGKSDLNIGPEEFLGKNVYEIWPVDIVRKVMACIDKSLKGGRVQIMEYPVMVKGFLRYEEARFTASGKDEVMMMIRDMTDEIARLQSARKACDEADRKAKDALYEVSEMRETLRAVVDTSGVDVIVLDEKGKLVFSSEGARRYMGGPLSSLNGNGRYELLSLSGEPLQKEETPLWIALKKGERVNNFEALMRHRDGREYMILVSAAPVYDESGKVVSAVASIMDI